MNSLTAVVPGVVQEPSIAVAPYIFTAAETELQSVPSNNAIFNVEPSGTAGTYQ